MTPEPPSSTWLVYPAKRVSGVVLPGLETRFAEVKVVAVPALKPRPADGEHVAAITPVVCSGSREEKRRGAPSTRTPNSTSLGMDSRDPGVDTGHQLHFGQQPRPVRLLREVHDHVLPVGAEGCGKTDRPTTLSLGTPEGSWRGHQAGPNPAAPRAHILQSHRFMPM